MQLKRTIAISSYLKLLTQLVIFADRIGVLAVVDAATVYAIRVYQKKLSPHKGFSCAYRKLHGSESCSQYFRQTVEGYGLLKAIPRFQQRLQACQLANLTLKAQAGGENKQNQKRRNRSSQFCNCSDLSEGLSFCGNCSVCASMPDCSGCGASDCSGIDCGGCGGVC